MESGLKAAETNVHEPKLFKVAGGVRPVMTEVLYMRTNLFVECYMLESSFISGVKYGVKFYMLGSSIGLHFISGVKYGAKFYMLGSSKYGV